MSRHFAPGRDGCNGGRAFQAMQSIADFGGIIPASALPYRGMGTGCSEAVELRSEVVTQLTSTAFHEIRRDESAMVAQLMESTLSIALSASGEQTQVSSHSVAPRLSIAASPPRNQSPPISPRTRFSGIFQSYTGGVIRAGSSCPTNVNHAVQVRPLSS